ncbi:hypothetical protein [endosymbiont GvMRE of Glomus versiforme]|uniref:hypothetical protein n=1 Tax=endosymbiont GvMRE of Glomus versiforme TaxID=2039283 RepID=UPI0011C390D5|nr:hypothetical protein [endosymbiont GvMRE of Glomus versiforme]
MKNISNEEIQKEVDRVKVQMAKGFCQCKKSYEAPEDHFFSDRMARCLDSELNNGEKFLSDIILPIVYQKVTEKINLYNPNWVSALVYGEKFAEFMFLELDEPVSKSHFYHVFSSQQCFCLINFFIFLFIIQILHWRLNYFLQLFWNNKWRLFFFFFMSF